MKLSPLHYLYIPIILMHCVGCLPPTAEDVFCSEHRCEDVTSFAPVPELEAYTAAGIDRLSRATGTNVLREEASGVPVVLREHLMTDGTEDCGQTLAVGYGTLYTQIVMVDPTPPNGCPPIHVTLLHEMIHALAPGVEHAAHGIFAVRAGGSKLDDEALVQLCSEFLCQEMVPE